MWWSIYPISGLNSWKSLHQDRTPRSALFEVRPDSEDDEVSKRIQKLLVSKIMRGGKQAKSPTMIRKLLKGSQGTCST